MVKHTKKHEKAGDNQSLRAALAQVKWEESSYTSLVIGAVVVVAVLILSIAAVKSFKHSAPSLESETTKNNEPEKKTENVQGSFVQKEKITGSTYVMQGGDFLWDIAVRAYGDGFRWMDIVQANNFPNPDVIEPGTVIKIPR